MVNSNELTREEQAWLVEYQVCEQDNGANSQSYWTIAGIFIAVNTALLAGIIYGVLSNDKLFDRLINGDRKTTLIVCIIAFIVSIAMIFILKMLKAWLRRIRLNIYINQRRMDEIELKLGMDRWWRIRAADKYSELKNTSRSEAQKVDCVIKQLLPYASENEKRQLRDDIQKLLEKIYFSQTTCLVKQKFTDKIEYEPPSSKMHHPYIFNTLILLWVFVFTVAAFIIIRAFSCWQLGLIAFMFTIIYIIFFILEIKKLNKVQEHLS